MAILIPVVDAMWQFLPEIRVQWKEPLTLVSVLPTCWPLPCNLQYWTFAVTVIPSQSGDLFGRSKRM